MGCGMDDDFCNPYLEALSKLTATSGIWLDHMPPLVLYSQISGINGKSHITTVI